LQISAESGSFAQRLSWQESPDGDEDSARLTTYGDLRLRNHSQKPEGQTAALRGGAEDERSTAEDRSQDGAARAPSHPRWQRLGDPRREHPLDESAAVTAVS